MNSDLILIVVLVTLPISGLLAFAVYTWKAERRRKAKALARQVRPNGGAGGGWGTSGRVSTSGQLSHYHSDAIYDSSLSSGRGCGSGHYHGGGAGDHGGGSCSDDRSD